MDKVRCMLIDENLTPKLWLYNNLPHSALDNHKSPNDAYGDSSDFSKPYIFGSICYALQPSKLLHKLEERSAKGIFLGVDYAGYKVLDLQSNVAYVARTLKVSKEENRLKSRLVAKKNEHRAVYRLKSCLVATRHSQKPGIDYNDTFAPVGDKVILRFVLSFALHLGYELYKLDIETAFLYRNLK